MAALNAERRVRPRIAPPPVSPLVGSLKFSQDTVCAKQRRCQAESDSNKGGNHEDLTREVYSTLRQINEDNGKHIGRAIVWW